MSIEPNVTYYFILGAEEGTGGRPLPTLSIASTEFSSIQFQVCSFVYVILGILLLLAALLHVHASAIVIDSLLALVSPARCSSR